MKSLNFAAIPLALLATLLTGCVTMFPPSVEQTAALPVVAYPESPKQTGDFIYKLPAGKPISTNVAIRGTALATEARQDLIVTLPRDIYIHKVWISEDLKEWKRWSEVLAIDLSVKLPSDEHPKPGEITLQVDRKK